MMRPRSPQSLGINIPILSDIPIVGPLINNAGSLLSGDICGSIPVNLLPGMKESVTRLGCSPIGRDALLVELNQAGGPVVAQIGAATVAACLCQGKLGPIPGVVTTPPSPLSNPLVLAGIAAAVIGLIVYSSKKSTPPAPPPRRTTTTATTTYTPTSSQIEIV